MQTLESLRATAALISFPDFEFRVGEDGAAFYLQVRSTSPCAKTGAPYEWGGRKWRISVHMTVSEVVQTALMAMLAAVEHEAREAFRYRGKAIFGPHFNVEHLVALCDRPDAEDVREGRAA